MELINSTYLTDKVVEDDNFCYRQPIEKNVKYRIRSCVSVLYDWFYKLLFFLFAKKAESRKYEISICAIFKNEAPFLKEWLEFHLMLGIDHFYLYNNNSEDDYLDVLKPYIDCGKVTLTEWPENPGQISSYKHFYNTYREETRWVSFLDLDEFICPKLVTSLKVWIQKYAKYPVVLIYWKMFGTSGKMHHDYNKTVTEQYTVSWPKLYNVGKLFYNTQYDISDFPLGMMHEISVKFLGLHIPPINIFGKFVKYGIHRANGKGFDIQVNHYWSKAYDAYEAKHSRGDAAFGVSPRNYDYFISHEVRNTSSDYTIMRFVVQLKQQLRRKI
jgi:hypothetical protein